MGLGKVSKGISCSVVDCHDKAIRSLPHSRVSKYINVSSDSRRVYLCETHYKELKKKSKKEIEYERLRYRTL